MLVHQSLHLCWAEKAGRSQGLPRQRVLHQGLKWTAQPASHRCLKALLAMIDDWSWQPLARDLFQNVLLFEAANLEVRRNGHHLLHEAMIKMRYAQLK